MDKGGREEGINGTGGFDMKDAIAREINRAVRGYCPGCDASVMVLEAPPKPELGDYAFPCFSMSRKLGKQPALIARELSALIKIDRVDVKAIGPYINFFVDKCAIAEGVVGEILRMGKNYGSQSNKGIVLIESPGPNTNKPLHLGHLRNMLLGSSISAILRLNGKETHIVNVVNDRGAHICKSMLAYLKSGKNDTPEKAKRKPDHFVGDYYVKYAKEEALHPELEQEVQQMLVKWEEGDKEIRELWKLMNGWALLGFQKTYDRLGFVIEKEYYESETYEHGRDIVQDGLAKGIFDKDETGSIVVNLEDKGLGKKVLLRANGTSVYITQDIYLAKKRMDDYNFNEMIYVVGNEQEFHFKVLFEVFRKLGWKIGDNCLHFSYGMVELPEGKMKSREGNVVDTDDLLDEVTRLALEEVSSRYSGLIEAEKQKRAEAIAKAAIRYFFLKFDPLKNFVFNPKESLSFEGDTGPYVLYAYARICSIFRKLGVAVDFSKADLSMLNTEQDRQLLRKLQEYKGIVSSAAEQLRPSIVAHYLFELASTFTDYYHANQILKEKEDVRDARLALAECTRIVIKSGLSLLGIEVLEQM